MTKTVCGLLLAGTLLFGGTHNSSLEDQESYNAFFELAKSGDVDSQTMLGEMFLDGIGVKIDHEKAFYWLAKAANNGDAQAQYLLGTMYENGLKVAPDIQRAVKWYEKAAAQGDAMAQYNLAIIYKEGKGGIEKDMKKAFALIRKVQASRANLEHHACK